MVFETEDNRAEDRRYKDKEGLDKHMKAKPVVELLQAISKEELTESKIIMTTKGPGIAPKL